MDNIFNRTIALFGNENMQKLKNKKVAIFGLGGVGSYAVEALCRSGIYNLTLFDNDKIEYSNINRQNIAFYSTIGKYKTEVTKKRLLDINPEAVIEINTCFYTPENADNYPLNKYDYIVDAIDTVTSKICLIKKAKQTDIPIISCMGTGKKIDPCKLKVSDIYDTTVCPLSKVIRKELRANNIKSLKVVYSDEKPISTINNDNVIGSTSFVPSVAGLIMASCVIRDLINK